MGDMVMSARSLAPTAALLIALLACGVACAAGGADPESLAGELLKASGIKAGLCVHLGCGDARLTAALTKGGNFLTHALALDEKSLGAARKLLRSRGLYGRASVERLSISRLPYAARTVNLLVSDDLRRALAAGLSFGEVARVLVPNGVALLGEPAMPGRPALDEKELTAKLARAGVKDYDILRKGGLWVRVRGPAVEGLGEWPHFDGPETGTWVLRDRVVGPPAILKWIDKPLMYMTHYSGPAAWVSGGGRVFYVYDERYPRFAGPARLNLVARDAYNGKLLWRKPVRVPPRRGRNWRFKAGALVAAGDRLYAPMGKNDTLQALDAETGEVLVDYGTPARLVRVHNGALLVSGVILRRLHPDSGKVLWSVRTPFPCRRFVTAADNVYIHGRRRNAQTRKSDEGIACVDLTTGKEKWWRPVSEALRCYHKGKIIAASRLSLNNVRDQRLVALDAKTGEVVWQHTHRASGRHRTYCIGDRVWYPDSGLSWSSLDIATGQPAGKLDSYVKGSITHHFMRCTGTNATVRFLITGNTIDFLDVETGRHLRSSAARASCTFGIRAANGMVYAFPVECGCFKSLRGVVGMAPEEPTAPARPSPRLVKAPAFGTVPDRGAAIPNPQSAWPCYRHDPGRSGSTSSTVPDDFALLWRRHVGGGLTAPTVAYGMAFVASKDTYQLIALDAGRGRQRWTFTPGGPIDTPPTLHGGAVYFGCRDGWLYCLRARDGALAWRYRVAPRERRIIALGRFESPVPVHGSVLVLDNIVYCSAGWTSELDGGVQVHALDTATGRAVWQSGIPRSELKEGRVLDKRRLAEQGALGDILRSDGRYVYMRAWRFDLKTGAKKCYYNWRGSLRPNNNTGFLDASMKRLWTHRVSGQMLVSTKATTCGFMSLQKNGWQLAYFTLPGKGHCRIFARNFDAKGQPDKARPGWTIEAAPIAVEAMAIAGHRLFVAGPPDELEPTGGLLWAVSLADGKKLRDIRTPAPPVFDGMAVAGGRLYVSIKDGSLLCFGKK